MKWQGREQSENVQIACQDTLTSIKSPLANLAWECQKDPGSLNPKTFTLDAKYSKLTGADDSSNWFIEFTNLFK